MIRTCKYCGKPYDTNTGTQAACDKNKNRERHIIRLKQNIVSIAVLPLVNRSFPK